jgi:integrase
MVNDRVFLQFEEGPFRPFFERYIEFRRGKGQKVAKSTLLRLKQLNSTLNTFNTDTISRETVEIVLEAKTGESAISRGMRISDLRGFCAFLIAHGIDAYQIPPRYARTPSCKFLPYIFSDGELEQIITEADSLVKKRYGRAACLAHPVLLRLLWGTGLRISEALSLTRSDVDVENGVLKVVNSKNGVSRYVPTADSLTAVLRSHLERNPSANPTDPFFRSPYTGKGYSYSAARHFFHKILLVTGIRRQDGRIPALHSLRHTFCTKSLEHMLALGMDIYTAIPILAAYVGHVNLSATERYIHLTAEGHARFVESELSLEWIIPEVASND